MAERPRGSLLYRLLVAAALLGAVVSGALLAVRGHNTSQHRARQARRSIAVHTFVAASGTGHGHGHRDDGGAVDGHEAASAGSVEPVATVLSPLDGGRLVAPSGEAGVARHARPWPPALLNPAGDLRMAWDLALGRPNAREVLFTFDDGPNPGTTDRLLNILDRAQIKAVFYVCGWRMESQEPLRTRTRNILADTARRGHVIGNHTVHHHNLANLNAQRVRYEIEHNADLIEEVTGQRPHLFRPPYGSYGDEVRRHVESKGIELSLWSIDSHDWQMVGDAQRVAMNVIRLLGNMAGGTVLLHDTHPWSVSAAQMVFRWLETENRERAARGRPVYRVVDAAEFIEGARERIPLLLAEREAARARTRRRGGTSADGPDAGASAAGAESVAPRPSGANEGPNPTPASVVGASASAQPSAPR